MRTLTEPGRRARAWAALATAAKIRPGIDLRNEALAALVTPDVEFVESFGKPLDRPVQASYSPDGHSVVFAEASADGRRQGVGEWFHRDRPDERQALETPGTRALGGYRFSRDQSLVMVRTIDDSVRVWRWGRKDPVLVLHRPLPSPEMLVARMNEDYDFGPDGTWIAVGLGNQEGGVTFNRLPDGAELGRFRHAGVFDVLKVAPDGKCLVVSDGTNVPAPATPAPHPFYFVEVPSGRVIAAVTPPSRVGWFEWSRDSRLVVATLDDNFVQVYDARDGRLLRSFRLAVDDLAASGFTGDDRFLVTRGGGSSVRITSLEAPSQQLVIDGVGPSDLTVDSAAATFTLPLADEHFQSYRPLPPVGLRILPPPRPKGYNFGFGPSGMDISPDGRLIATGFMKYIVLRDSRQGHLVAEVDSGHDGIDDLEGTAFGPEAKSLFCGSPAAGLRRYALAGTADGGVSVGPPRQLDPPSGFALAGRSPDRTKLLLIDQEHEKVKVLAIEGDRVRVLGAWDFPGIYAGAFNPAGNAVLLNASGLGPNVAKQRLQVRRLDGSLVADLGSRVSCDAAWSADGRTLLTSAGNQESIVWDAVTFKPRLTIRGAAGGNITTYALSGDGGLAAIQRDRMVHFVRLADGTELGAIDIPEASGFTQALRFMPDGQRVAVLWNEGRVDLIDLPVLRGELRKIGLDW